MPLIPLSLRGLQHFACRFISNTHIQLITKQPFHAYPVHCSHPVIFLLQGNNNIRRSAQRSAGWNLLWFFYFSTSLESLYFSDCPALYKAALSVVRSASDLPAPSNVGKSELAVTFIVRNCWRNRGFKSSGMIIFR